MVKLVIYHKGYEYFIDTFVFIGYMKQRFSASKRGRIQGKRAFFIVE
jgi:hypothetical protein